MPNHSHGHAHSHDHADIARDPSIYSSERGIRAVRLSLACLGATAALQTLVFLVSGSVALLADTVHNFGDAASALPLWVAFRFTQRRPTERFTYGFGRVEDAAGLAVLSLIAISAVVAGYEASDRLVHPQQVTHLPWIAVASLLGFVGNEWAARLRITAGTEIGSAALVADGMHARTDALTSLAVLIGAIGVSLGFSLADPIVGIGICATILWILCRASIPILTRVMDGIDPETVHAIQRAARSMPHVCECNRVRVRWSGHRMQADLIVSVTNDLPSSHTADLVREATKHAVPSLEDVVVEIRSRR